MRIKRGIAAAVWTAAWLLATSPPMVVSGQDAAAAAIQKEGISAAPGYEAVVQQLSAAISGEMEEKRLPALSVALVDGSSTVWASGFGFEDAERSRPASAGTVYRVGSVSKLMTDVAIMQLVEQGRLELDAPVTRYVPDFQPLNPYAQPITLRQLMSHRAGLVREPPIGHYFDPDQPTLAETVASLNQTQLVYPPGSRTKYSNAGVTVAGRVLEAVDRGNAPFEQILQQRVLRPLAMDHSSFAPNDSQKSRLAMGWMWTYDGRRFAAPQFALGTGPAGNLYATVADLAKFLQALIERDSSQSPVLSADSWKKMLTPALDPEGKPSGFGLGFHIDELDGRRLVGHGGAVYGFATQLEALPDEGLGVAVAASLDGSNGVVRRLALFALRLLLAHRSGQPLPHWSPSSPVASERIEQLIGTYQHDSDELTIVRDGEQLWMRRGEFNRQLRSSDRGLVIDDVFGRGPEVALAANGDLLIGSESWKPVVDQQPPPAPARWRGLIGEYGWDHNTLYILEDRGQLCALIEWFYFYPLREVGQDTFAFPDYGLYHGEKLIFSRDAQGRGAQVVAAEVRFLRRELGVRDGETFRIRPVQSIDVLRRQALQAQPPTEAGDFRKPELVQLTTLDDTIRLDIRYATRNNFMGEVFYRQPRAFVQRPAAEALARVQQRLRPLGLGLLVHDAYRPWHVTKMFWDATPKELRDFVANPASGSRHNRGCAVDLTLCELENGKPVEMVSGYDEFSPRSFPNYPGGTALQRWLRQLLRRTMKAEGFAVYEFEWWHFDYQDWRRYPILNQTFEDLLQ